MKTEKIIVLPKTNKYAKWNYDHYFTNFNYEEAVRAMYNSIKWPRKLKKKLFGTRRQRGRVNEEIL